MKPKLLATLAALLALAALVRAQGTAFTYQGRLNDGANAADGFYDLRFTLYDAAGAGTQQGDALTNSATAVSNGLFTVTLDFGPGVFTGGDRWLEIGVHPNGVGGFTTLRPRQSLTPTPYAVFAEQVSVGGLPGGSYGNAVVFDNASNRFSGSFAGNGDGLSNVAAASVGPGNELQYLSAYFRKLSTVTSGDGLMQSYGVGAAAVGDFNRDGRPDVLVSMAGIGVSQLYLNTGGGALQWAGEVSAYFLARRGVVADFNGDGWPDLAENSGNNDITVLSNTPSGGFAGLATIAATDITAFKAADINGDGKSDLIVAVAGPPARLQTFLSSGSAFVLLSSLDLPSTARDVAAGDLDGDGRTDIVAACPDAGRLAIFTNTAGALVAGPTVLVERPRAVAIARLNAGPQADLVCLSDDPSTDWRVRFLYQSGALNFQPAGAPYLFAHLGYYTSDYGARLTVADFNGDGWPDVVAGIGYFSLERMALLINPGGTDVPKPTLNWTGPGIADFGVADFNGDGRQDLGTAVWTSSARGGAVWLSDAAGINVTATSQFAGSVSVNGGFTADGGVVVSRGLSADTMAVSGPATFQGGAIELGNSRATGTTPYLDFHYGAGSDQDFNVRLINDADGQLTLAGHERITGNVSFGAQTRQMLNLWGSVYGVGVQSATLYSRSDGGFAWHRGGGHSDAANDPGPGGTRLMALSAGGDLALQHNLRFDTGSLRQMVDLWNGEHAMGVQAWATYFRTIGGAANGAFVWYKGGVHNDVQYDPGGGVELMRLNGGGLTVRGVFVSSSDRNAKEHFQPVNTREVLEKVAALPMTRWNFKEDASHEHLGPMAQDFHAAFGLGIDDKHIATVDADGVALAAIQGLNEKLEEKEARIRELENDRSILKQQQAEISELKQRLEKLEQLLHAKNGGAP
jgi:hypothetical protein